MLYNYVFREAQSLKLGSKQVLAAAVRGHFSEPYDGSERPRDGKLAFELLGYQEPGPEPGQRGPVKSLRWPRTVRIPRSFELVEELS
jgi:hypothetical protein